ncbi:alcohol dehydrogenase GroES-like domain-containing protein [Xylariaceae sp. AK1471]|nr:alcohol dehydrogenase GroES-like domain-containing protein [Xylariaceae sp. AK1471]
MTSEIELAASASPIRWRILTEFSWKDIERGVNVPLIPNLLPRLISLIGNTILKSVTMADTLSQTYRRAVFKAKGASLAVEQAPLTLPATNEILIKVEACGICHSDVFAQENIFGGGFPRVPGHEIIGKVVAIGEQVIGWELGDRLGSGYHGGYDGSCAQCKNGWTQMCSNADYNGITRDGGLAEYCLVRASAAVHVPAEGDAAKWAPLLCAGSTVFTALKAANITAGHTVAIQGFSGLGHLAIQYAVRMGYRVIAISRGSEKEAAARALGAHEYIDATKGDAGEQLWALGGAQLALTTALSNEAFTPLIKGLRIMGKLLIVTGVPGPITVDGTAMIMRGISVQVWPAPNALDNERTLEFSHLHGIESAIETFSLDRAQDAFGKLNPLLYAWTPCAMLSILPCR